MPQSSTREIVTVQTPAEASSFVMSKTGDLAAAVCRDEKLRVWTLPQAHLQRTIDLKGRAIDVTVISGDGRWIVTGDHKGDTTVWDRSAGEAYLQLRMPPYPGAAAFSHDDKLLAIAPMGEAVQVYDMAARRKLFELGQAIGGTGAIAFSRDGTRLATADGDTVVRIYDAHSGKPVARYTDFLVEPFAVAFTADGKHAIAGGGDKVIAFIDTTTGKAARRMDRTAEPPVVLQLSPDGISFAAVFMKVDNMLEPAAVVVWDVATGRRRAEWMPPSLALGGGWTTDGRLLIATATKDALHIWQVE